MNKNPMFKAVFGISFVGIAAAGLFGLTAQAQTYDYGANWYSTPQYAPDYSNYYSNWYDNWSDSYGSSSYGNGWYDPYSYDDYSYGWNSLTDPYGYYDDCYLNGYRCATNPTTPPEYCYYWDDCYGYGYGTLSISNVSGPTQLNVGQSGTWRVNVSDSSSYLSYSVSWGDEQPYAVPMAADASMQAQSSGSFSHTYRSAGNYTIRFTVTNAYGQSDTATASVVVSGGGGCTGSNCSANFTATPTSGAAPLYVIFYSGTPGTVNFGDGTSGSLSSDCLSTATDIQANYHCGTGRYFTTHIYSSAGNFTATLYGGYTGGAVGSVVVTVSGTQQGLATISASPTSGQAPLAVGFTGVAHRNNSRIDFGDGNSRMITNFADPYVTGGAYPAYASYAESYTYQHAGTYTATLYSGSGEQRTTQVTVSGVQQQQETVSASPTSGQAPLGVSFQVANARVNETYYIDYGDGASEQMQSNCYYGAQGCSTTRTASHTYTRSGSFTATVSASASCPQGSYCAQYLRNVGSVTVTVSGSQQSANFTASPASGQAPLNVSFRANGSAGPNAGNYRIDFGDGASGQMFLACYDPYVGDGQSDCFYSASHTYTSAGTYVANLIDSSLVCITAPCGIVGTATINVGAGSTGGQGTVSGQVTVYGCAAQNWWVTCQYGYQTTVDVFTAGTSYYSNGVYVKSFQTDANGNFSTQLPAGEYVLLAQSGQQDYFSCQPQDVTVRSGQTAQANIFCDIGIR